LQIQARNQISHLEIGRLMIHKLLGWLMNSMAVEISTQFLHCETSKQLWNEAQSLSGAHTRS